VIEERLKEHSNLINTRLLVLLDERCADGELKEAMSYSLMAGGKRLRPSLCLMSAALFGDQHKAIDFACALEMIHTYSLIHDDLPAMDNDTLRRGKPTSHVVFGEANAILAGDGLLNLAFEVMIGDALCNKDNLNNYLSAMQIIANASGVNGMIAGQVADIAFEGKEKDYVVLEYIHKRKTAAMIRASVLSGAVLFGASALQIDSLSEYGECIGLVFQIVDDILDVQGDQLKVGKTLHKDSEADKQTYVSQHGIEESKRLAADKTQQAIAALSVFGSKAGELSALAQVLLSREK
jgi:geranylgeranyl diphosphate synthase, type II